MIHHADAVTVTIIVACYLIFAVQMFWQTPARAWSHPGGRAIMALVLVFILCSGAGYISDFLPEGLWWFREGLHIVLAGASIWLVVSNQSRFIARLLSDGDD